jgi:protein associated with RNAse G/E
LPIVIDAAVRVVYRKYDGSLHWHQTMNRLGEDTHGVWLGASAGVIARKGEHGPPVVSEVAHVMLFAPDAWWTASFNAAPHVTEIYVDVTTPPVWTDPAEVTMVDMDLDVLRRRADRSVIIVDQDEFAEHQVRYAYPADVIAAAEKAADWLHAVIGDGAEPFANDYRAWLAMVS